MYLYKYVGVLAEPKPNDPHFLIDDNISKEEVGKHISDADYVRIVGPTESGEYYYDIGSWSVFLALTPNEWK